MNASEIFTKVTCPILLVGGEKDLQCDPGDVARIAALTRGSVDSQVIAGMTHVLRCDDQPPTLLGVRRLLGRPVEPKLLELVAEWVRIRAVLGNVERPA